MLRKIVLFGLMCLFFAAEAQAQGLGFGPQVGYHKSSDADEGSLLVGGALRMRLSAALGIEGSITYREEKYNDDLLTVKSWPVMVTGLFYPLPILYGAVGAGWYNVTFDYDQDQLGNFVEDQTSQEFGWHFGGGVELPVGENTKLAADIRYVFLNYDFEQIPGSEELQSDFYVLSVSLFWGL